ncbi:ABC transporter permease subunit [Lactonifactor sp. BIOML-A3]|uniref:carbohydrate ABC transporter permease n=1 Tax=unclassified Lactonifactor TaxID=2636670 RepID=UPI0012B01B87|nr:MULTISPECIES: sugar ABC transporter permease [unclassified Lactonifactor]MSA01414.1 ABC transporter permease subunit [Lactonifactor sp. BIOML-A5]MSA10712.1 ABC transporter permease subunit [Lactonifactor sp. BIOML-A4]MSA12321.1 ABC transporter permease subunit [Lactonifactor sp. BIOML-A3]MSA19661.1 ABC transporter permease subunit [Lactonifactor sp. BIOML-A2]MSA38700.1 ABC transporter permease subunit [Lactonifactor sp. BIOML-A1]
MSSCLKVKKRTIFLYMLPGILWYSFIILVPVCLAAYYGMFDWAGGTNKTFLGIQNYLDVIKDPVFRQSLGNNIYLTIVCLAGQIGIAFILAVMLNGRHIKFKGFHRTMSYFPAVLSAVVIGFIWNMLYDYHYGLLNSFLKVIGQGDLAQAWLNNDKLVLLLVAIPLIWQYVGYYLLIIMSALSSVDPQIFEMAEIDGASGFKRAIYITLPLIKNTLIVCVTLCIAGNMKIFDHIYAMTGGGPGTSSSVMAMYAYKTSFMSYKMGYGSAMSIIILIVSLILVAGSRGLLLRFGKDKEV